jgi:UDP-N-acetylglucosamine 1-carboxyvinyltransferase
VFGAAAIARFFGTVPAGGDMTRYLFTPTRANGRPAVVMHHRGDDGTLEPHGIQVLEVEGDEIVVPHGQRLEVKADVGDAIPKIEDGPWPAFPADLTSIALALATQADGEVLIFEKMFENRLFFVDKLVAMGARVTLCDPHRAIVSGPSRLHGERVESPDIRAGMAMLIAALAAEGTSEIGNIRQIDRGYEAIDDRLRSLGAQIERIPT